MAENHVYTEKLVLEKVNLQKMIGLKHAIAIMSGVMVGSGIFVSPVSISEHCGSVGLSLVVWVVAGLLALLTCLSYGELAGMIPGAGGDYAYYMDIFGNLPAFIYAWYMFLLANPAFYALLALTTTNYLLQSIYGPTCAMSDMPVRILAICVLAAIAFLNCVYVRFVTRVQIILTACKFAALIFICITGIVQLAKGNTTVLLSGFEGSTRNPGSIATAMYSGIFTYSGWQYIFALMEEVKNPTKNIPRATYASFVVIILVYALANVAYFSVMSIEDMKQSSAVAVTFAEKTLPGYFTIIISIFVACSTIGALNGSILGGSRIYFAAARDGTFPSIISMISIKYLTPIPAVIFTILLAVVYVLTGSAIVLVEYLGFAATFNACVTVACAVYLRYKQPNRYRPIKLPFIIPVVTLIINIVLTVLGLIQDPVKNGIGVLLVATGFPVYAVFVAWSAPQKTFGSIQGKFLRTLQKIFMMVPDHTK